MKQTQHITATLILASLLTLNLSGCSEKDEPINADAPGISIESITASMEGLDSNAGTTTRATQTKEGFSVNNEGTDPTYTRPEKRSGWKMDFTMYNGNSQYAAGSFTEATYSNSKWSWNTTGQKHFPNYKKPQAEAVIYPTTKNANVATDQGNESKLLAQDILQMAKGAINVAHDITITVNHKHSMLDFVIKNVVRKDIDTVTVLVGGTTYTPYKITTATTDTDDIEYMLILPEGTGSNPVVEITTTSETTQSITYKQTIGIIKGDIKKLGSNNCYCFTLQGADLKISPVTVLNWATGKSLPGEYIAVTAYPTFKAEGYADQTFYFYYDSKLKENGKAKLQEIKFNKNAECTIKPDGRILTHIYTEEQVDDISGSTTGNKTPKSNLKEGTGKLSSPVTLGTMVIDLIDKGALTKK